MMSTNNAKQPPPHQPRALKRQVDHSLFANDGVDIRLYYEDSAALELVRNAAQEVIQPTNDFERIFTQQAVRNFWRSIRAGNCEAAAIDVEMADRQRTTENNWGNISPEAAHHFATREPQTRAAIREYGNLETAAIRCFKETVQLLRSFRKER
ncbi:MAG TPA: hypothetical protein VGK29_06025 [Paludibaculum sp.]|jgi:hypothetical protein